jgi:hypothetical protein
MGIMSGWNLVLGIDYLFIDPRKHSVDRYTMCPKLIHRSIHCQNMQNSFIQSYNIQFHRYAKYSNKKKFIPALKEDYIQ